MRLTWRTPPPCGAASPLPKRRRPGARTVTVTTAAQAVTGWGDDFAVYEDGIPQTLSLFGSEQVRLTLRWSRYQPSMGASCAVKSLSGPSKQTAAGDRPQSGTATVDPLLVVDRRPRPGLRAVTPCRDRIAASRGLDPRCAMRA